jgi:hypothetical protein
VVKRRTDDSRIRRCEQSQCHIRRNHRQIQEASLHPLARDPSLLIAEEAAACQVYKGMLRQPA